MVSISVNVFKYFSKVAWASSGVLKLLDFVKPTSCSAAVVPFWRLLKIVLAMWVVSSTRRTKSLQLSSYSWPKCVYSLRASTLFNFLSNSSPDSLSSKYLCDNFIKKLLTDQLGVSPVLLKYLQGRGANRKVCSSFLYSAASVFTVSESTFSGSELK